MVKQETFWESLEKIAEREGIALSTLARQAGLDKTSMLPSKRYNLNGAMKWPSTETIGRVLNSLNISVQEYGAILAGTADAKVSLPAVTLSDLKEAWTGLGVKEECKWSEIMLGSPRGKNNWVVLIDSDRDPILPEGTTVVADDDTEPRPNDRVVVVSGDQTGIYKFRRLMKTHLVVSSVDGRETSQIPIEDVTKISRVARIEF